jgi:hypothetical protein
MLLRFDQLPLKGWKLIIASDMYQDNKYSEKCLLLEIPESVTLDGLLLRHRYNMFLTTAY